MNATQDMAWAARMMKRMYDMHILGVEFKYWPSDLQQAAMWAYEWHNE